MEGLHLALPEALFFFFLVEKSIDVSGVMGETWNPALSASTLACIETWIV